MKSVFFFLFVFPTFVISCEKQTTHNQNQIAPQGYSKTKILFQTSTEEEELSIPSECENETSLIYK